MTRTGRNRRSLAGTSDPATTAGRAWRGIAAGVCAWFAIDSTISVVTGFPLNAVSNTLIIAMLLAPVPGSGVLHKVAATAA